ncbi:LysR family transcriptional regulator, partial [Deltaproteobacteria bacterium]|nr:LysR family transcriptional regulator [Deltaproteobacteria bacterium]
MDRLLTMEAFLRVVDAGSFSAAARQWGRSKAVVSKYVNALEDHLGVELLR